MGNEIGELIGKLVDEKIKTELAKIKYALDEIINKPKTE